MTKEDVIIDTKKHMDRVSKLIDNTVEELKDRAVNHDASKLSKEELDLFVEYTPRLKEVKYGSAEYKECLVGLKPALDHHYAVNRHHPEYHENGIEDMDLMDLLELVCDWKAASERHSDGCVYSSIEINKARFKISDQLATILKNTAKYLEEK